MPKAYCAPTKWWTPTTLLAHCTAEGTAAEQLWTVPIDGGPATALTAVNTHEDAPGFEGNYGNWTAYQTPSGTYLPTAGACGTTFVSRLTPDGHTERVNIVGARGSVGLIGPIGDKLAVVTQVGCGGGTALLSYNPATDVSSVLLGPPALDGGIDTVLPYPS
jgi:TolB protein